MEIDAAPPTRSTRESRIQLVRVPPGASWCVLITATRAVRTWTHWTDGRTMPCPRPQSECGLCDRGLGKRWEAYLGVWNVTRQVDQIVGITALAWEQIEALLPGAHEARKMRGWSLILSRRAESRRSRLCVERGYEAPAESVPKGVDVPEVLRRCWGLSESDGWYAQFGRRT